MSIYNIIITIIAILGVIAGIGGTYRVLENISGDLYDKAKPLFNLLVVLSIILTSVIWLAIIHIFY